MRPEEDINRLLSRYEDTEESRSSARETADENKNEVGDGDAATAPSTDTSKVDEAAGSAQSRPAATVAELAAVIGAGPGGARQGIPAGAAAPTAAAPVGANGSALPRTEVPSSLFNAMAGHSGYSPYDVPAGHAATAGGVAADGVRAGQPVFFPYMYPPYAAIAPAYPNASASSGSSHSPRDSSILRDVVIPRTDPSNPTSSFGMTIRESIEDGYKGTRSMWPTSLSRDFYHPQLKGKVPLGILKENDIIVSVNGTVVFDVTTNTALLTFKTVVNHLQATPPGCALRLDVLRKNQESEAANPAAVSVTSKTHDNEKPKTSSLQPARKANELRLVRVTKRLPKYGASNTKKLFTPQVIERIRDVAVRSTRVLDVASSVPRVLELKVENLDKYSIILTATGRSDLIDAAKVMLKDTMANHILSFKHKDLLTGRSNIELDLLLDSNKPNKMGVLIHDIPPDLRGSTPGVWFTLYEGQQMSRIIGRAIAKLGGVILKIGGKAVNSLSDVTNAWNAAATDKMHHSVVVTICLHKDADTSDVDSSRLVREPRRRGGGAYRGSLHAASASTTSSSSTKSSSKRRRKLSDASEESKQNTQSAPPSKKPILNAPPSASASGMARETAVTKSGGGGVVDHQANYKCFRAKMSSIFDIEFKSYGFSRKAVISSSWNLHKRLVSDKCDDGCDCPSRIPELCANVVKEHLRRKMEEEGAEWTNPLKLRPDKFPVGFISTFIPKFYDKVSREMQGASPSRVLEMLIEMWSKHRKPRCGSLCSCDDDWERIFKAKVIHGKKIQTSTVGTTAAASSSTKSYHPASKPTGPAVPKKNARAKKAARDIKSTSSATRPPSAALAPAEKRVLPLPLRSLLAGSEKSFSVPFNVSAPLGFFFVTDRRRKSGKDEIVCKVASVCPYVGRRNAQIKVGSIVLGTAPVCEDESAEGQKMESLDSHLDLKQRYAAARKAKSVSKLLIWFTNSGNSMAVDASAAGKRDWATSGAWLGHLKVDGWPGGAITKKSGDGPIRSAGDMDHVDSDPVPKTSAVRTEGSFIDAGEAPRSCTASNTAAAGGKSGAKRSHAEFGSLLLPPERQRRKVGKKVSFSHINETREYVPGTSATGNVLDDATSSSASNRLTEPENETGSSTSTDAPDVHLQKGAALDMDVPINQRRSRKLFEACWNGTYKDVLRLLREGAPVSKKDGNNLSPYDYVKKKISEIEKELQDASPSTKPAIEEKLIDFGRKSILLKIWIHVEHNISLAQHILDWQNIRIAADSINGLELTPTGKSHPSSNFLFCVMILENRHCEPTMPVLPISKNIDMTMLENRPSYLLTYNPHLPFSYTEGREVRVDLVKGTSRASANNARLGTWIESVEFLKNLMVDSSDEEVLTRDLQCSEYLEAGSMTLSFKRAPLDDAFFRSKREEIGKRLHVALDWIQSFKEDTGEQFHPNISLGSNGDLSILHAAIYSADSKLVSRLLALGADPTAASAVGTAENLCVNLASQGGDTGPAIESIMHRLKKYISSQHGTNKDVDTATRSELQSSTDCPQPSSPVGIPKTGEAGSTSSGVSSSPPAKRSRPNRWRSQIDNDTESTAPAGDDVQRSVNHAQLQPHTASKALPTLPSADWMEGKYQHCRHQKRNCPMGGQCPLAHVSPPLGLILQHHVTLSSDHAVMMTNNESFQQSNLHLKTAPDATGKRWYTAAYVDPAMNVVYYAEGGTGANRSKQGIFWYSDEGQAILAMKRVVLVALQGEADLSPTQAPPAAQHLHVPPPPTTQAVTSTSAYQQQQQQSPPPIQPTYHMTQQQSTVPVQQVQQPYTGYQPAGLATSNGLSLHASTTPAMTPQHLCPPPPPPPQVMMQDTAPPPLPPPPPGNESLNPSDPNSLYWHAYQELLKFSDMQAVYAKIFPGNNLKKSCWKSIRNPGGSVSTDFHSPGERDAVYSSTGWNGTLMGERYYYPSERDAKYAAFMNFLVQASHRHLVKPDLSGTTDGKAFFVKKRLPK